MKNYTVKQLAKLAGVSIRTLHLYDELNLLKPLSRTESGYRKYGERELLRLQQILFYKEMDISLSEIAAILDDPDFNLIEALNNHKMALIAKRERISGMLKTIDETIVKLKKNTIMKPEELYAGFTKEKAVAYRKEATEKYGKDTVMRSEFFLKKLGKERLNQLKIEGKEIWDRLQLLMYEDFKSEKVQQQIALHYENVRMFWGTANSPDPQAEKYIGLGQLYVNDGRFTITNGKPNPRFALFMSKAMAYYAGTLVK